LLWGGRKTGPAFVNGAPTTTCSPNVKVDENVYTVGVLGSGRKVPNCRRHCGKQKDGCRRGFPLGSIVSDPPGWSGETVNGTESQNAGKVAREKMAASEISVHDLLLKSKNRNRPWFSL
jgi:hypothetical protein